jgi:hypothetical protein
MPPADGKTNSANTQQDYRPKVADRRYEHQSKTSGDTDHLECYPNRFAGEGVRRLQGG